MDTVVFGVALLVVVVALLVVAAGFAFVYVYLRRRASKPAPEQLSRTSEDRTFVGIGATPRTSDATMVGPVVTARADATIVDARASTPDPDAPTAVMSAPPAEAATVPTIRIPKLRARVTVTKGGSGTHDLEAREYAIGRSAHADIVLADPSVSGHHAKIAPHGDAFAVSDLGSTNGTTVDGRAVQGEYVLRGGETIGIGDARLRYERLA